MSAAEIKALREHLGVTGDRLALLLGISPRQVRKWESGTAPVPVGITAELGRMVDDTVTAVDLLTARARETGLLVTYRTDEEYRAAYPDSPWSASWHRGACARALERCPGLRLEFAE